MVDGSNESLYHADEEMHPLAQTFSPSQTIFQNLDVTCAIQQVLAKPQTLMWQICALFWHAFDQV